MVRICVFKCRFFFFSFTFRIFAAGVKVERYGLRALSMAKDHSRRRAAMAAKACSELNAGALFQKDGVFLAQTHATSIL